MHWLDNGWECQHQEINMMKERHSMWRSLSLEVWWRCDQEHGERGRKTKKIVMGGHAGGSWVKKTSHQFTCHENVYLLKWMSAQPNFWLALYAEIKWIKTIFTGIGISESSWLSVIYMKNKKIFLHWPKLLTSEESSAINCYNYWCQRTKIQMII